MLRGRTATTSSSLWMVFAVLSLGLGGCGTVFKETHYFKSQPIPGELPNYYRLTVTGRTGMSNARYLSGYFDEEVLNQYFNEIGQPAGGKIVPISKQPDPPKEGETPPNGKSTGEVKNPALLLLLSSNSDDVANQIGALAQSKEFTASLARIAAGGKFDSARGAELDLEDDRSTGQALVAAGEQLLNGIDAEALPPAELERRMIALASLISRDLGGPSQFPSLELAARWLSENRSRIVAERRR